ncbi:MAG: glucose uptake inhibitor SgrT [Symbiopectobacterium sp.]
MATSWLNQFYRHYFLHCPGCWLRRISSQQKLVLLQQVTQWHTDAMSEEEYRQWL